MISTLLYLAFYFPGLAYNLWALGKGARSLKNKSAAYKRVSHDSQDYETLKLTLVCGFLAFASFLWLIGVY